MGCLIIVRVFADNVFDGKATRQLITELFSSLHTITKIWTDSGYSGPELSDWLWHPIRMPDRGRYKQGFPASTCYLVDGRLKEPLLGHEPFARYKAARMDYRYGNHTVYKI